MRRQLTAREWMLLGVLAIMLAVSGYVLLFYNPMTAEKKRCISETETCQIQIEAARLRIEEKHRMERELKELFASENPPLSIPDFDNIQPVMMELNSILAISNNYNLTFSTVDASQTIVRRSISMSFTTDSYQAAKEILRQLHGSNYRCMMDDVSINFGGGDTGSVSVNATIVFFEYQSEPQTAPGEREA